MYWIRFYEEKGVGLVKSKLLIHSTEIKKKMNIFYRKKL